MGGQGPADFSSAPDVPPTKHKHKSKGRRRRKHKSKRDAGAEDAAAATTQATEAGDNQ